MRTWTAMVAPLGTPCCEAGPRVVRDDVEWALAGRPPLRPEPQGHDTAPVLGEVTRLSRDGDKLMLHGTLFDEVDLAALDELAPQIDVDISSPDVWRLRSLTLGKSPAWPDLWFRVDPEIVGGEVGEQIDEFLANPDIGEVRTRPVREAI